MEKLRISPVYRPYDICVQYKGLKLIVWTLISISRGQPYFKDCILTKKECCIMYDLGLPRNSGFGRTHANRLDANPPSKYSPHFDSAQIPKFAETLVYINIVYLTKFVRRSWLYQLASPVTFRLAIENNNNHCVCMYLLIVGQSSYFSDFCPPRRYCFYRVLGRERGGDRADDVDRRADSQSVGVSYCHG